MSDVPATMVAGWRGRPTRPGSRSRRSTCARCSARSCGRSTPSSSRARRCPARCRSASAHPMTRPSCSTSAVRSTTRTHALLYCAAHLPDPRDDRDTRPRCTTSSPRSSTAAGGRTLALFTSWRAMQPRPTRAARARRAPILAQGDLPKPDAGRRFTDEHAACLFATMGFWQGIDVPGPSLSLVTIDRLPFPRPDDPLLQARRERAGADAFAEIDLPEPRCSSRRATGRLIRSATDRGVVAVFDSRLATAGYRWDLVRAPCRRCDARVIATRLKPSCTHCGEDTPVPSPDATRRLAGGDDRGARARRDRCGDDAGSTTPTTAGDTSTTPTTELAVTTEPSTSTTAPRTDRHPLLRKGGPRLHGRRPVEAPQPSPTALATTSPRPLRTGSRSRSFASTTRATRRASSGPRTPTAATRRCSCRSASRRIRRRPKVSRQRCSDRPGRPTLRESRS